ncbi:MAG: transketolase [Dehalococcoidia bacterium]|mgnify:FL=1|nr:transketolase [Chloroflexota bacterium]RZP12848.1 MAG: transketolase [Chloroflexota bacterium]|tara:strand:+ start:9829 stop:11817 length:1989 start_codon:yes stop_codon:yes gene_type:complete
MNIEEKAINTLRFLSVDQVNSANSGHPGAPMGAAPIAYTLFKKIMNHSPSNPRFHNRDRFILSIGHASALLYSVLHLTGYNFGINDLKKFRKFGSKTPGHPERDIDLGIEVTTGPLGQGFANGVGMAISEKMMSSKYKNIIDHYIYGIVGDGDLQEGISSEAASLAGTLGLGKLVYIYDSNGISIDGSNDLAFTENVGDRFKAYGWEVFENIDGLSVKQLEETINKAKSNLNQPTLIIAKTTIGYGSPNKSGKESSHGEPLGEDETKLARENLKWKYSEFEVPEDVLEHMNESILSGKKLEAEWNSEYKELKSKNPDMYDELDKLLNQKMSPNWDKSLLDSINNTNEPEATRASSGVSINLLKDHMPNLIGGSADLTGSTNTEIKGSKNFSKINPDGRNIKFGVREHGMGGIMNGISAHGNFRVFGGTFLVFSDYMRGSVRLSALSNLNSIWIFTHDSIGLGEDGPTHQPISQLMSLRGIPNLNVYRPADKKETLLSWHMAITTLDKPSALILSRQGLPDIESLSDNKLTLEYFSKGAYICYENTKDNPEIIFLSTGSEVSETITAAKHLSKSYKVRVVSMPCWDLFDNQTEDFKNKIIPPDTSKIISVEAGIGLGWQKYTRNNDNIISIESFGASGPGKELINSFGFSSDRIIEKTKLILR